MKCLWSRGLPVLAGAFLLCGCGPEPVVQIRYDRPATYEIPESVVSLGIAEFGGQTDEDRKWGNIAADRLAMDLDSYNRRYSRYQLVDRKRLKAILDEQDLQAAFSDPAEAVQAGRIARVDAMIYGSASVTQRDDTITRTGIDPLRRSLREVQQTRRYVMAAVNFTITDISTGKALGSVTAMREFDSDEAASDGSKVLGAMGFANSDLPAADQVTAQLIHECVEEFVSRISPHEVVLQEKLRKGRSEPVRTGNKLAEAGSYDEALEMYLAALEARPDDHEAAFNAGVMCEKLRRLEDAGRYYDRSFRLKPEQDYVTARQRVRREIELAGITATEASSSEAN